MEKYRHISDIPNEELKRAVAKMCADLRISGSVAGYDLYESILQAKQNYINENEKIKVLAFEPEKPRKRKAKD